MKSTETSRQHTLHEYSFTKKDWLLFRNKIEDWQEKYLEKLCREYIELLSGNTASSDKFWALYKRIKEDHRKIEPPLRSSKANFIPNIVYLLNNGIIEFNALDEFSDELKETVKIYFSTK